MKKYWVLLVLLFVGLYIIPAAFAPLNNPHSFAFLKTAILMLEQNTWSIQSTLPNDLFGTYVTLISIRLIGITDFAVQVPMLISVGITAIVILLIAYQCTHDSTIATAASAGFMCAFGIIGVDAGSINAFLPFSLLGVLFMAYREDDFSFQRLFLLIASGILSGLVFISYGTSVALLPLVMAIPFLLWEKRVKELLLMPWLVLATAGAVAYGLLLLLQPFTIQSAVYLALESLKTPWYWFDFNRWNIGQGLLILTISILPMLLFISCVIKGYMGRKFLQLRLYRMAVISSIGFGGLCWLFAGQIELMWFYTAFKFGFIGSLSILFAGGFINYLRISTRHRMLGVIFNIFAVLCAIAGAALAVFQYIGLRQGANYLALDNKSVFLLAGLLAMSCLLIYGARRRTASIKAGVFLLVFIVIVASFAVIRPALISMSGCLIVEANSAENARVVANIKAQLGTSATNIVLWSEQELNDILPSARQLGARKIVKVNPVSLHNTSVVPISGKATSISFAPLTLTEIDTFGRPAVIIVNSTSEVAEEIRQKSSAIIRHRDIVAYIIK